MQVTFFLKGAARVDWRIPDPKNFNFQLMVKMIRADGQFLAEGVYIQASEIAAIIVNNKDEEDDEDMFAGAEIRHRGKLERLS
jgi:hypothetical protein